MFTKKQIWALMIPLMIEQVLTSLMGTADTMMVSIASSEAISAVSLVDAINVLIIYVFSAMATGGAIICAQYLGMKQKKDANDTGMQLVYTVTALSIIVTIVCVLFREPILQLIFGQVDQKIMDEALIYFLITAISYPFIALYNAGAALFRVDGNSRLPMIVSTISNVINIIGNAIFIFLFNMSAGGAALATLISRIICAVAVMYFLRGHRQSIVIRNYFKFRPNFKRIINILSVGIPSGIENGMFQFGKLAIQSTVSILPTAAIAAQAMTSVLETLMSNAPIGIGLAMMTIVGQCMGAGLVDEARKNIKKLTFYSEVAIIISCSIMALAVKPITAIAMPDPEAASLTISMTLAICIAKPLIWVLSFIPAYGMRAAGDVRFSMIVASLTMWLCRVIVAIVLIRVFGFGPIAVWIGMFADWAIRSVIFTMRFFSNKWTTKKVIYEN